MRSSQALAEQAAFQNFANCYRREIDPGRIVRPSDGGPIRVEWSLPSQCSRLQTELVDPSLCGPNRFGRTWLRQDTGMDWLPVPPFSAVCALVRESYHRLGSAGDRGSELELLLRVLLSYQSVRDALDTRGSLLPAPDFIAAEQGLIFGHTLHPTPKSLQGMADWQKALYAPEAGGRFPLMLFAVPKARAVQDSSGPMTAASALLEVFGPAAQGLGLNPGEVPLPMHPLQTQALLADPVVRTLMADGGVRLLGPGGPEFTATSSVRTVYSPDSPWMLKFSLPVRITNSVRVNRRHELAAGVIMARLIGAVKGDLKPGLRFLLDPAYITLDLPGRVESGFEVILRENPFQGDAGAGVSTLAALTADPRPGDVSNLAAAMRAGGHSARDWFRAYLAVALVPLLHLYDAYGVALEAHQQNGLLALRQGWPEVFYYRDNQGFYLSERYRAALRRIIPEADNVPGLYYDEEVIHTRFSYYLIVNQVFGVIARLGRDRLCTEEALVEDLRACLIGERSRLSGAGRRFVAFVLDSPSLGAKFNLTVRLHNIDELAAADENALYAAVPNPLWQPVTVGGNHAVPA